MPVSLSDTSLPEQISLLSGLVRAFAIVQYRGCLRVSEVLNLTVGDILPDGSISVQIAKKGHRIVIDIHELRQFFIHCSTWNIKPFSRLSYKMIYTAYKNVGLTMQIGLNKHKSVTHTFRHLRADILRNNGQSDEVVSQLLHHKSTINQSYYGIKTNKQSEIKKRHKL